MHEQDTTRLIEQGLHNSLHAKQYNGSTGSYYRSPSTIKLLSIKSYCLSPKQHRETL
ncbi:hypothetical protein A359_06280 [secondary endosymbiont of Ctenarytaina eucalypti]|uniref:Uncharacterized protein n=1 Tax=secondary endosymbiont of Ctenarytaina eucalypti TaxID=1199245 RepID=J3Z422_9ENTR|nr:hypothetical protein A359_06280 [secondary endosymbiont of Ctenarytaina eucalypti]